MTSKSYKRKLPQQYEGFESVLPKKRANISLLDAPSNIADVAALSAKYKELLDKGAISQETLNGNFPGFTQERYQQILKSAELYYTHQLPSFDETKSIVIELNFPKPWDPSTATLCVDLKFVKSDGVSAMDPKDIPVNWFPFSWFKMIKVMEQNTTTPINNAEDGIREKCLFDIKYNSTKDYQDLIKYDYITSAARTTTGRCSNTVPMTDLENVKVRIGEYGPRLQKIGDAYRMNIDLATVDKFFAIQGVLDPALKFRLEIILETDMNKLFETNRAIANDKKPHDAYNKIVILQKPFVRVSLFGTSTAYETTFNALLASKRKYTLHNFYDQKKIVVDLAENKQNFQFTLPDTGIQFEHLVLQLYDTQSMQHESMYDTHDTNYALIDIQKIEITGIYDNEKIISKTFNLDDKNDQYELYQNYLSFKTGAGLSMTNMYHYKNLQRDGGANSYERGELMDQFNYFMGKHRYGKDIIIDSRPTRGYTEAGNTPMPSIKPTIKITLRNPTKATGQKLYVLCNHAAKYEMLTGESRVNKIVYSPVTYKN